MAIVLSIIGIFYILAFIIDFCLYFKNQENQLKRARFRLFLTWEPYVDAYYTIKNFCNKKKEEKQILG